jgi:hypothetical protein
VNAKFNLLVLVLFLPLSGGTAAFSADSSEAPAGSDAPPAPDVISTQQLDRAIVDTLRNPEYAWRAPRQIQLPDDQESQSAWMLFLDDIGDRIERLIKNIKQWLNRWLPKDEEPDWSPPEVRPRGDRWPISVQALLFACLAAIAVLLAIFLWRYFRRRRRKPAQVTATPVGTAAALLDETASAAALPADEWMNLARDLIAKGELRLALRALFLAGLAYLGQTERLTLSRGKSNRDYQRELERRAHDAAELLAAFRRNTGRLERSWYGCHPVTAAILAAYLADHSLIAPPPAPAGANPHLPPSTFHPLSAPAPAAADASVSAGPPAPPKGAAS